MLESRWLLLGRLAHIRTAFLYASDRPTRRSFYAQSYSGALVAPLSYYASKQWYVPPLPPPSWLRSFELASSPLPVHGIDENLGRIT